jgi:histidinol-phosphate aminotransferase
MIEIAKRARQTIVDMPNYKSARSQYKATDNYIFLDANEAPYEPYEGANQLSRYVDQQPQSMICPFASLYQVNDDQILATRGSDEAIDVLTRTFCEPHHDNVIISSPTFPMYAQASRIHAVEVRDIPLNQDDFSLNTAGIKDISDKNTKLIFICTPNNPTGSLVDLSVISNLCDHYKDHSIIVVDEAYIEFSDSESATKLLTQYQNIVILRTLSKAYASAGLRCGVAIAHPDIIHTMQKVLAPYPMCAPVVRNVLRVLEPNNIERLDLLRSDLIKRKKSFEKTMESSEQVVKVLETHTNFSLFEVKDANVINSNLKKNNIMTRPQTLFDNSNYLRVTIGSNDDMKKLLKAV